MELNQMGIFATVAKAGSFTRAAEKLAMPKSTVSRQVSQLEEQLGARLLHRTTRQLRLTELGKRYYEHCRAMVEEAWKADMVVQQMQQEPTGRLRIAMPLAFGNAFMQNMLQDFLEMCPKVSLELVLENRVIDIVEEGIDVAFRTSALEDSSLIARPIGFGLLTLCATPEYLKSKGEPFTEADLTQHDFIRHPATPPYIFKGEHKIMLPETSRMVINDMGFILQMTLRHIGLGVVPALLAKDDLQAGNLQPVFPGYCFPQKPFYLVYASRKQQSTKISAFVNFVMAQVDANAPWGEPGIT